MNDQITKCEDQVKNLLKKDPLITFLLRFVKPKVICAPCFMEKEAGYDPFQDTIQICSDKIESNSIRHALAHNLVHAFDNKTIKIDFKNCLHYGCTEIRASLLSSECSYFKEFSRGHFAINKAFQNCVKRRAILSIQDQCPNAEKVIDQVFDKCFQDTSPFDEIY